MTFFSFHVHDLWKGIFMEFFFPPPDEDDDDGAQQYV